jgi:TPR repeat protein
LSQETNIYPIYYSIAEFLLGFLIEAGYAIDDTNAKEYYTRIANQLYTPAQIQLGMLLLLEEKSSEGVTWLEKAAQLVRRASLCNHNTIS